MSKSDIVVNPMMKMFNPALKVRTCTLHVYRRARTFVPVPQMGVSCTIIRFESGFYFLFHIWSFQGFIISKCSTAVVLSQFFCFEVVSYDIRLFINFLLAFLFTLFLTGHNLFYLLFRMLPPKYLRRVVIQLP